MEAICTMCTCSGCRILSLGWGWGGGGGGGGGVGQSAKKQGVQGKIKQKIHARQVNLDRG